jgi:hypothetical protein
MYINANADGNLLASQKHLGQQSLMVLSAFAKTGVIAVIDEATGYLKDKNRAKDELQKFLNQFMREDAAVLVRRFEDSFFEMIYKMRGWTWTFAHKSPGVVGRWINDIVYERIAPTILEELRKKNPITEKGRRKNKHHQFLSDKVGIPKLLNHLAAVEALGKASGYDWNKFMDMLDVVFPKQYQQISMIFDAPPPIELKSKELPLLSDFNEKLEQGLNWNPKEKD